MREETEKIFLNDHPNCCVTVSNIPQPQQFVFRKHLAALSLFFHVEWFLTFCWFDMCSDAETKTYWLQKFFRYGAFMSTATSGYGFSSCLHNVATTVVTGGSMSPRTHHLVFSIQECEHVSVLFDSTPGKKPFAQCVRDIWVLLGITKWGSHS